MLSFVVGGPGSGKTEHIINMISGDIASGKKVLVIVPEQEALSSESRIIGSIKSQSSLFDLEIVSFRRLCNVIFRRLGGLCYNYIDRGGQAVLMWRVLSELSPFLKNYKISKTTDTELISSLITLFSEFADYKITPVSFEDATQKLNEPFRTKAEDIALIYTRYDELLHSGFDSQNDDIIKSAKLIIDNNIFCDTNIYVDSFTGFTPAEYTLVSALISQSKNFCVTLCADFSRDIDIFANILDTKKRLCKIAAEANVEIAPDTVLEYRGHKDFSFFEKKAFDYISDDKFTEKPKHIEIYSCKDKYSECELIAADIAAAVRGGLRYRDIRIVTGGQNEYDGIIDAVLSRHSIPYHYSAKEEILQKPLVKAVICALNIIIYNWRYSDIISFIKTGMSPIDDEESDIIEEYLATWQISGSMWKNDYEWNMNPLGYTEKKDEKTQTLICRINEIRDKIRIPLITLSENIRNRGTIESAIRAIYRFMSLLLTDDKKTPENILSQNALVDAFEQLVLCGGECEYENTETLKRLLRAVLCETAFTRIPSAVDEISIGAAGSFRGSFVRQLYMLGVNDGIFPKGFSPETILADSERRQLKEIGVTLSHDPIEMETEGLWVFYRSLLSASDKVTLTYNIATLDGKEAFPSAGITEIKRLFPEISVFSESDIPLEMRMYDAMSAIEALNQKDDKLYSRIKEELECNTNICRLFDAFEIPVSTGKCRICNDDNLNLFSGNLRLSQTKLDSFVHCKFAYTMDYILKLREQRTVNYDPRNIGNFIHSLLERYFKEKQNLIAEGIVFDNNVSKRLVDRIVDEYLESTIGNMQFVTKRMLALFGRLRRHAIIFIHSIESEFENSDFKPRFFELPINNEGDESIPPYKIKLSDGSEAYIYGQIDRVDTFEKNGKVYFRIVDYKTGKKEFKREDIEKGLNLQMLLYIFSIMNNKEKFCDILKCRGELVPSGLLYYMAKLSESTYDVVQPYETIEKDVISSISRRGLLLNDDDIIAAMSNDNDKTVFPVGYEKMKAKTVYNLAELGEMESKISSIVRNIADEIKKGIADAEPMPSSDSPCKYCKNKPICRKFESKEGSSDE